MDVPLFTMTFLKLEWLHVGGDLPATVRKFYSELGEE